MRFKISLQAIGNATVVIFQLLILSAVPDYLLAQAFSLSHTTEQARGRNSGGQLYTVEARVRTLVLPANLV